MNSQANSVRPGFSLIELVIVVVIIAIIGAIAIPRLSRGAAGAADSALISDLATLRKAIDLYQTEHGGTYPSSTKAAQQLTQYTDQTGEFQATADSTHIYGPYLRAIPALPVGTKKGQSDMAASDGASVGWIYDSSTGNLRANTTDTSPAEADARGALYSAY
jgi:general secretion pathway protein G